MNNVLFLLALLPACYLTQDTMIYNVQKNGLVVLTKDNFKSTVLEQHGDWLVIFDGDMKLVRCEIQKTICDDVKNSVKVYEEAFVGLKAIGFKIGRVDFVDTSNRGLIANYPFVKGFPSYVIFGKNKDKPILFNYKMNTAKEIVNMVKFLNDQPLLASGQCGRNSGPSPGKSTYELSDDNFKEVVLQCPEPWLVVFYASGDKFSQCNMYTKKFEEAAGTMLNRVKFGKFHLGLSKLVPIYNPGYVVCKTVFFRAGDKSGPPLDYNHGIASEGFSRGIVPWLQGQLG